VFLTGRQLCFNTKSFKYQLKSSSVGNIFIFATWFMHLKIESRTKTCHDGFIDMKIVGIKYYFDQNT